MFPENTSKFYNNILRNKKETKKISPNMEYKNTGYRYGNKILNIIAKQRGYKKNIRKQVTSRE